MPARKSDASAAAAARRSDVSVARFVLADDIPDAPDTPMSTEPPASAAAAAAPPAPTPSSAETPAPTSHPAAPGSASPNDKRPKSGGGGPMSEKGDKDKEDAVTIEDLALPKSIITRLAKGVLPANTQIQANAILALTKSATVFINHLANAANENTLASNKKTIMPPDVFKALDDIEYGFMKERLELEFAKFNSIQTSKRSTYRKKVAAAKKAGGGGAAGGAGEASFMSTATNEAGDEEEEEEDVGNDTQVTERGGGGGGFAAVNAPKTSTTESGERSAKKAKLDAAGAASGKMEVDGQVSDAETVPDEEEEEEEDEDEAEEEDEEEEEEESGGEEGDDDDEEKVGRRGAEEDEALDDDSD
ncbi:putative DNA polymerase epsilon subunit D [Cercophora samala]|uniref:DNA polymerase epsilon subunit D n=1 Tax=Cercophora samala TaxID=330535 RepID=A0AA39ZF83_9PEZI|nr:putative DNA polymerase epsilon subunit D [Cercophora samala]